MEPIHDPLIQLANQLSKYIIPIIITSNSVNIIILTRRTLSKHACSFYFIAHAAINLFYISIILIYRLLSDQYLIDPAKSSILSCKIIVYIQHLGIFLAPNFLVLASIDRWCASSTNIHLRKFSTVKVARWIIFVTISLFSVFFINSAVLVDLRSDDPFGCRIRADTISKQVYVFIQSFLVSFVQPILMFLFGLMTIYNIKKTAVVPVSVSRDRRTGRQLSLMLIIQVLTHVILNIPVAITYLIFVLPNNIKFTSGYIFVTMISFLPFHASYATAFFLYILSSKVYRKVLKQVEKDIFRWFYTIQVGPLANRNMVVPLTN